MTCGHHGQYSSWTTCNVIKPWHAEWPTLATCMCVCVFMWACVCVKSHLKDLSRMRSFTDVLLLLLSHDSFSLSLWLSRTNTVQGRLRPCHKTGAELGLSHTHTHTHKNTPRGKEQAWRGIWLSQQCHIGSENSFIRPARGPSEHMLQSHKNKHLFANKQEVICVYLFLLNYTEVIIESRRDDVFL